jgi:tetratricopeptide (TPR) repeat protein
MANEGPCESNWRCTTSNYANLSLGEALLRAGDAVAAAAVLRPAQRRYPGELWLTLILAQALEKQSRRQEAIRYYMMARSIRPQSAHLLAHALEFQGETDEAIAEFRHAIRLEPGDHKAHSSLGSALSDLGWLDEAVAEYRETIRLMPEEGIAHHNLGVALFHQGRVDDALAEYRETIRLSPNFAEAHYNLADTLRLRGLVDEAIEEYREAIRLKPDFAEAHCNLATELKGQGRFAESLAEFERGHELGSKRGDWQYPSAMWIDQVRRLVRIEHGFTALVRGEIKPASVTDRLDFAYIAHTRGLHATSARLWAESLALQPTLASDPTGRLRYAAARCAVLAGCGQGREEPPPDEAANRVYAVKHANGSRPIWRRG